MRQLYVDRKVSLDAKKLSKAWTTKILKEEIKDTHFTLTVDLDYEEPEPRMSGNKDELVKRLIALRTKWFQLDDESAAYLEDKAKQEFDDDHQPELSMEQVVSLDIYKLSQDVLAREEYTTPLNITPTI